jgi:hypothetical protein
VDAVVSSALPIVARRAPSAFRTPLPVRTTIFALAIVVLNLIDAFGTLRHLAHGAEELNPIMQALLDAGPVSFVLGKHLLACGGIIGILAHHRYPAAGFVLRWVLFPIYLAIATYQIVLLGLIP